MLYHVLSSADPQHWHHTEIGWRPPHPMTAAVKMRKRMTLLIGWYLAPGVLSYITLCRSAWLSTRTGERARARSRLSKTAWWISKLHGKNSCGGSSKPPFSLHPAEIGMSWESWHTWGGTTVQNQNICEDFLMVVYCIVCSFCSTAKGNFSQRMFLIHIVITTFEN